MIRTLRTAYYWNRKSPISILRVRPSPCKLHSMPTAAFTTLGCKVNQYETQRILDSFEEAGFGIVPFESPADVYVINTCSVTSVAEGKSRATIRRAARHNPAGKVVVTGCAAQMALNKTEALDGADVVVPNTEKLRALEFLYREFPEFAKRVREEPAPKSEKEGYARSRATLKIQDGCCVFCSYCSIPYTRPKMVSRPWREVIEEAEKLVSLGYREIVLTGVLIGSYGPETGSDGPDFETLVERIADVPGLDRVRISSIEMPQVSDRLIELIREGKVVPHLHIPLQSGDTQVLKDMNRRYTQDDYLRLCERLYREVPDISITADVMVGFPTEDERAFQSTVHVCESARYLKTHVFRFSPRWGTPADEWGDPVPNVEKVRRSQVIAEISTRTGGAHIRRFLGRTLRVLAEGKEGKDGLMRGHTDNFLEVAFAAPGSVARGCVWVTLHALKDGQAYGELAAEPQKSRMMLPAFSG